MVVVQTYAPEEIAKSNYYLALELKERALSNRNRRAQPCSSMLDELQLIATDFGVQVSRLPLTSGH